MQFSSKLRQQLRGSYTILKAPAMDGPPAQRDPAVIATVSEMLKTIEAGGLDAALEYARQLDNWQHGSVELTDEDIKRSGETLSGAHRAALELGSERTRSFALAQRAHITDFEVELAPGLFAGQRYIPVGRVGAYLPAGRFPLTASAFMTIGVAKVAGVPTVIGCTPPRPDGTFDPAVVYSAYLSGVDQVFVLGGVQALAAMAFGLLGEPAVDMLVGAGNAYVAEAKRQLFGKVAIDLLAGPSEVAIIADHTADPKLVAADLLGQAEHGSDSPAALVTTSEALGRAVVTEVDAQLLGLSTRDIAGPAWRDHGSVILVDDRETAIAVMDDLAPEHLELQTEDDAGYHDQLRNYGSIFLGPWSTVAYSDKGMGGTNHVLPTAGGARHSAGLSVSRFLKPLTYQRAGREATPALAEAVEEMSAYEGMSAHGATATLRLEAYRA
jgi:sulfopropanediol 3-dehydrogenase